MRNLTLTRHFCRRWQQRVGNYPTVEAVRNYLANAVRVQTGRMVTSPNGECHRIMGIYWCTQLEIIIIVDTVLCMAVTVYSRDMVDKPLGREKKKPARRKDLRRLLQHPTRNRTGDLGARTKAVVRIFGARRANEKGGSNGG